MTIDQYKNYLKENNLPLAEIDVSRMIGDNALMLIVTTKKAVEKLGWPEDAIRAFIKAAMGGDYSQVVKVCQITCNEDGYRAKSRTST